MKYGYFDDENREYVITKPDTPAPWANYLGSPEYGALISNNAGGYSFAKSGANGRILRYVFNSFDRPGRYIYIRDDKTKDYWSASWQPVGKDLDTYESEVRNGIGYTKMKARYAGIESNASYYVPLDKTYEVWALELKNESDGERDLTVTGYAEFTNHSNYEQDQVNLQYSLFISRTVFENNMIVQKLHGNLDALPEEEKVDDKKVTERFFGLAGADVSSYCGDRKLFIGKYHDYGNPVGVEKGDLGDELSYNENSCGALSAKIRLAPGERKTILFALGEKYTDEAKQIICSYANTASKVESDINELKEYWSKFFDRFVVKTPSREFDTMINTWNAYNCFMTFIWSRAASFTYCGLRNGYGYRDTVQDIQGVIHLAPKMAKEKIRFMLSAQVDNGGGLPLVKFTHNAGSEDTPDDASYVKETGHPAYRADDALWLFPTVYKYIAETGDMAFIDEEILFANNDSGTVYEHLKRAIDFTKNHLGPHGMPAGLYADWNDCLRLGKDGESTFVAFQYYYALIIMQKFAEYKKDEEYRSRLEKDQSAFGELVNDLCWNEDRFIRGFTELGQTVGYRNDNEASMWLNPQSWAVISGLADKDQTEKALDKVNEILNTDFGLMLMDPPYHAEAFDGALAVIYNQGVKENSGIFSQSQGWIILAEALAGHGNRAFEYFIENAPSAQNENADVRVLEPYCYGQFTEGKYSPHYGRSHVHWLTGTASTMMVGCVEGILGIRPDFYGIKLSPSIPSYWREVSIDKFFRGKTLHIVIKNTSGSECG
ncbi:MAG: N,N'-diacetylchitobiose phosphorylase, partial [Lachnospiraceae bacterium]|nr:N,N'-diacetylchitobiose phosphorylase [Lachnospiraceae bacterium]